MNDNKTTRSKEKAMLIYLFAIIIAISISRAIYLLGMDIRQLNRLMQPPMQNNRGPRNDADSASNL
jgi:hypothetical protein